MSGIVQFSQRKLMFDHWVLMLTLVDMVEAFVENTDWDFEVILLVQPMGERLIILEISHQLLSSKFDIQLLTSHRKRRRYRMIITSRYRRGVWHLKITSRLFVLP